MGYRIPENIIEEVRQRNDIVDVISGYINVKRSGSGYMALCPFHDEKTPSFSINQRRQFYHCFGCGKSGSVFTFVMEMEKLSFPEAVRLLAGRVGVTIPDSRSGDGNKRLYELNAFAARKYNDLLLNSKMGEKARVYLKSRGLTLETAEKHKLGYAPDKWDFMVNLIEKEGFSKKDAIETGLVVDKQNKNYYYDRFRSRLMFPILTTGGMVAGFGGRTLSGDSAKYLNTPETSIYKKGRILYGLYGSKEAIRNANVAYIVEGYTDYLSLFQAGVENVIASSGTAFTSEQAALISRFTRRVILVFDADQAGNKAMERSIPILLKKNLEVLLATLPKGDDPDSFVRRRGREGFLEVMSEAVDFLDYQISGLLNDFEKASPMEQARMLRPVLENIDNVGDKLAAGLYRKRLAGILGINEKVLEGFRRNRMHSKEFGTGGIERGSEKVTVTTRRVSFDPIETAVLEVLLSGKYSASRRLIEFIGKVDFTEGVFGKIFTRLSRSVSEGEVTDISWLMDNLPSYVASVLAEIAEKASGKTFEDDLLKDIATRIRERDAALRREVLMKKIRDAGDDISPDVLREYHELAKKTKVK